MTTTAPPHDLNKSARRHDAFLLWFGKPCVIVAWLGLLLALVSPPHGSEGIQLCWLHGATGIPCLGCGLTRSLSCALRGMFVESWHYHPMGALILVLFLLTAILSLLPRIWQARVKTILEARAGGFTFAYLTFVTVFVTYGSIRALLYCGGW